jgi:hypothetical protein
MTDVPSLDQHSKENCTPGPSGLSPRVVRGNGIKINVCWCFDIGVAPWKFPRESKLFLVKSKVKVVRSGNLTGRHTMPHLVQRNHETILFVEEIRTPKWPLSSLIHPP